MLPRKLVGFIILSTKKYYFSYGLYLLEYTFLLVAILTLNCMWKCTDAIDELYRFAVNQQEH